MDGPRPATGSALVSRKDEHLDVVLSGRAGGAPSTGLERVRFVHEALPELDVDAIDLSARFLGRTLKAPLIVSSMTGGPSRAETVNRNLAEAAQAAGIAFAVGSQRVALEAGGALGLSADLRRIAPDIPILANLGGAQLAAGYGLDEARRAIDMIEADALIVHLNPLQEAVQREGDRRWAGVLAGIERLAAGAGVPIVVKEVGCGISGSTAMRLVAAGASVIDVAGAGGTSWAAVEAARADTAADREVAAAFADWGIPTADAILAVRRACPQVALIGSGGIRDGIDVARAIRIGADVVGQAAPLIEPALVSAEAVAARLDVVVRQLRTVCFCTGSRTLDELRRAPLMPTG